MRVRYGKGGLEYGPGVMIELNGEEIATAIDAYLTAHCVHVSGPRTINVNGELIENGGVYVDPSGFVISEGEKYSGRGEKITHSPKENEETLDTSNNKSSPKLPEFEEAYKEFCVMREKTNFPYTMPQEVEAYHNFIAGKIGR